MSKSFISIINKASIVRGYILERQFLISPMYKRTVFVRLFIPSNQFLHTIANWF